MHWVSEAAAPHTQTAARGATDGIAEFMETTFMKKWHPSLLSEGCASLPTIQCLPLARMLNTVGVSLVNYFVLDVEGGELEVCAKVCNVCTVYFLVL